MLLIYDPEGDVVQVELLDVRPGGIHHSDAPGNGLDHCRGIDRAESGEIVGYYFMGASDGVDLRGLPHEEALFELFSRCGQFQVQHTYESDPSPSSAASRS
ncbi:MAG: hypothetical protein IT306_30550 [Chloroflexi bacterium]|nr:hypothetical protein [Chloroflexota bacterium]